MGLVQVGQDQDRDFFEFRTENTMGQFKREIKEELEGKANLEDVKQTLDHVAETVDEKLSRSEVQSLLVGFVTEDQVHAELEHRPTRADLARAIERKVEEEDFKGEIARLHERIDRLTNEMQTIHSTTVSTYDFSTLKERLDRKADLDLVKEGLRSKVNADEFAAALAKKAEFEDFEEILERKVDGQDLKQIIEAIEKKADQDTLEELFEAIKTKADSKDVEMISVALNKKADKKNCEDSYQQIQTLRKEVEGLFVDLETTLDDFRTLFDKQRQDNENLAKEILKKANKNEIGEFKQVLSKKIEGAMFVEELAKIKEEVARESKLTRADVERVESSNLVQKVF